MSFRVVGYRDLRPLDWVSGKRLPLEAGEGHICDRCGAEHAVVFEVLDDETGKHYAVGSSCATKQFGFEPSQAKEAKALIRSSKDAAAEELETTRHAMVVDAAERAASYVHTLPAPEPEADRDRYPGAVAWSVGDSKALAAHGRTDEEAQKMARRGWYENRARDLMPPEWNSIYVKLRPAVRTSKATISMLSKALMLVMDSLL